MAAGVPFRGSCAVQSIRVAARRNPKTWPLVKRLAGVEIDAIRPLLMRQCFVEGKGFSAQYPGDRTTSCATTAICLYALSEMGLLSDPERKSFLNLLLSLRVSNTTTNAGAFPRTTSGTSSVWTT